MSSSESGLREGAESVIDKMASYLDEEYVITHIDEPIDRAVAGFAWDDVHPFSHQRFHEVVARFVAHLYAHGLPCPRSLSPSQAHDEAVAVLEEVYEGTHDKGYVAAIVEAVRAQPDGLEVVLSRLADCIKDKCRRMHVRWVSVRFLASSDWALRCEVAAVLLDRLRPWLPEEMRGCRDAQFADDIPALLTDYLEVDGQLTAVSVGVGNALELKHLRSLIRYFGEGREAPVCILKQGLRENRCRDGEQLPWRWNGSGSSFGTKRAGAR